MKNKKNSIISIVLFVILFPLLSVSQDIDSMFPNLLLTKDEYNKWKTYIESSTNSVPKDVYNNVIRIPAARLIRDNVMPNPVASLSVVGAADRVKEDMARMQLLATCYLLTQNIVYLNKAKEFYLAWAAVNNAVEENSPAEAFYNSGIIGYSIIRHHIDSQSRSAIDAWMRRRVNVALRDRVRFNNWETIRLQFLLYYGLVLDDQSLIDKFDVGLFSHVPKNIYPNGTSEDIIGRDAFAYHAYNLFFYAKIFKALAAYYGVSHADEAYTKKYRWGVSIKDAVDFWIPYIMDPVKFSHVEFVETEWYDVDRLRDDYNKPYNPRNTMYVLDELYYVDENLKVCIEKYRNNAVNATLPLWYSALRWY